MQSLFPWREPMGFWRLGLLGFGLAIAGIVIIFGLATAAEPFIRETLFSWVPEWFVLQAGPAGVEGATRTGLLVLWVLSGLVGVGIGGVTQELYSRGFLLPRSAHLGWMSVPLNASLFAMMHLAAPWGWPFFFFGALLWGAAVYRWRSIQSAVPRRCHSSRVRRDQVSLLQRRGCLDSHARMPPDFRFCCRRR